MTRFARAKGSKGSNARVPDSGTPWEVMKKQLDVSQTEAQGAIARKKAEDQRIQNYQEFLTEEQKKNIKRTWCDFPGQEDITPIKSKKQKNVLSNNDTDSQPSVHEKNVKKPLRLKKKVKKNKINGKETISKQNIITFDVNNQSEVKKNVESNSENLVKLDKKRLKRQKKNKSASTLVDANNEMQTKGQSENTETTHITENDEAKPKSARKRLKKLKENNNSSDKVEEHKSSEDHELALSIKKAKLSEKKKNRRKLQKLKKRKLTPSADIADPETKLIEKPKQDRVPIRRKPFVERSFKIIVGGEELELVHFDGFPVLAKDAIRLRGLQEAMIAKGIPKSEIFRTMKLERRRAEKDLTRLKKVVCYNCRMSGHLLSECPEIANTGNGMPATGICFKCGSTEHKSYDCKVQKGDVFNFSKCFICKEQGHIARQCPDHPKGLYPKGGACKLCGDVTHFKKDCPTILNEKEDTKMTLDVLEQTENLEDIGPKAEVVIKKEKKAKVIKF